MKNRIYIITGPTASGKTDISIKIAKKLNGEIISADSMQIYKEMDVGTAKIKKDEMHGIEHHLLDFVSIDEDYSVAMFQKQANELIYSIIEKGKMPVIVGGTGLYINSILYDLDFSQTESDSALREKLSELTNQELYDRLLAKDPLSAKRIHLNDTKRLIRRLEVMENGTKSDYDFRRKSEKYDAVIIGITMERSKLYENINKRVDIMIKNGLLSEAKKLFEKYGENLSRLKVIGYKELIDYFLGKTDLETAVEDIKRNTRRFAKRQMTWFNREEDINWFNKSDFDNNTDFETAVLDFIKAKGT